MLPCSSKISREERLCFLAMPKSLGSCEGVTFTAPVVGVVVGVGVVVCVVGVGVIVCVVGVVVSVCVLGVVVGVFCVVVGVVVVGVGIVVGFGVQHKCMRKKKYHI